MPEASQSARRLHGRPIRPVRYYQNKRKSTSPSKGARLTVPALAAGPPSVTQLKAEARAARPLSGAVFPLLLLSGTNQRPDWKIRRAGQARNAAGYRAPA